MQNQLPCILTVHFVCLFVSAYVGCVERMQKQMHVLGAWRRALHASLCLTRMQQFLWGQVRMEVAVMGKQLLSIAGFLTDGRHFLGRQCCFLLQHNLGWKAFVLRSILGSQRCFLLQPETSMAAPKCPSCCTLCPFPLQGQIQTMSPKVVFFTICPYEAKVRISPNQGSFLSGFAIKESFLCNTNMCWWLQEAHREAFLLVC